MKYAPELCDECGPDAPPFHTHLREDYATGGVTLALPARLALDKDYKIVVSEMGDKVFIYHRPEEREP